MAKKEGTPKKQDRKNLVGHVARVAKKARVGAGKLLLTGRGLPPPVEIEPRPIGSPVLRALHEEKLRLLDEIKRQETVEQDRPTTGNHMADDATEVSEQAKALALRRHLEGMLKELDRAIMRAEKGMYGVCERCGCPISQERLEAMPAAVTCIQCAKSQTRQSKVAA